MSFSDGRGKESVPIERTKYVKLIIITCRKYSKPLNIHRPQLLGGDVNVDVNLQTVVVVCVCLCVCVCVCFTL